MVIKLKLFLLCATWLNWNPKQSSLSLIRILDRFFGGEEGKESLIVSFYLMIFVFLKEGIRNSMFPSVIFPPMYSDGINSDFRDSNWLQ